jgi:uncharacterized protein involved in exopolysaccharide biosynthesis
VTPATGLIGDALRRRLPGAMLVALLGIALALALAVLWPPVYRAEAVLLAEPPADNGAAGRDVTRARISAVAQRMMTRSSLLETSDRLALHADGLQQPEAVLDDMRRRIALRVEGGGDLATTVTVSFDAPNPRVAANVANALAEVLMAEGAGAVNAETVQAVDILRREARRFDAELEQRGTQLAAFREANRDALPDALPALQRQAGELQARLATADPTEDRVALQARLEATRAAIARAEANAVTLARLERDLETARDRYESAMTRAAALRRPADGAPLAAGLRLTLIEPAQTPTRPARPNRGLIVAGGVGLGLMLALGFGLLAEAMDQTVRRPADLVRRTGLAPFATIPYLDDPASGGRRGLSRLALGMALPAGVLGGLVVLHLYVAPLDLLLRHVVAQLGLSPLLDSLRQAIAG